LTIDDDKFLGLRQSGRRDRRDRTGPGRVIAKLGDFDWMGSGGLQLGVVAVHRLA
jgi:hypothetical protein